MVNYINKLFVVLSLSVIVLFTACKDDNYLKYDISYTGVYFTKDTLKYSFSVTPIEVKSHEYRIPVKIMGVPSNEVREIAFVVTPLETNSIIPEEGKHYRVGKALIQPDSITGYIPVIILRDHLGGDYNTGYPTYRISLQLIENDNFTPTLSAAEQVRVLEFDNAIDTPEWLDYKNDKIWVPGNPHPQLGSWHPYTYIKLAEQFKTIKDVPNMKETYEKMVEYYGGDNLERVPYASFYPYLPIMQKYVLAPLYEYFNDPVHIAEINEMYDDYPFDFPNPYAPSNE